MATLKNLRFSTFPSFDKWSEGWCEQASTARLLRGYQKSKERTVAFEREGVNKGVARWRDRMAACKDALRERKILNPDALIEGAEG